MGRITILWSRKNNYITRLVLYIYITDLMLINILYLYYYYLVIYCCGDFIYYIDNNQKNLGRLRAILLSNEKQYRLKIQKVLLYDDLPDNLKSKTRYNRSLIGEVWLQDELFQMIKLSQVYSKTNVMIAFQHQHISENSLQITEIVYKCHDHWQIHDAKFLYQHSSKYITIKSTPYYMPIYKLFIDLYYDDFETYRNVYHSLGGVYI